MTSAERVRRCSHQEPDRVPWDFWATPEIEEQLLRHLRLSDREDLLRCLGVDLRYHRGPSYSGTPFKAHDDDVAEDLWGVLRKKVTVDTGAYRWTYSHLVGSPLEGAESIDDVERYGHWPSAEWWDYSTVEAECAQFDGFAVVCAGDRLDRTAQLKPAMYLRGMEQIYLDLYQDPGIAEAILSHIVEYFLDYNERVFRAAHGKFDIFMMGDDFGAQNGLLVSVDTWRKFFKKGFKQYIDLGHKYGMKIMHHTCGAVVDLIPDFIDCGLDILQSLQPGAAGMDLEKLKSEYGRHLSFHGSIDIQHTLPTGSAEDIRAEVKQRMAAGKPDGGFIISTAHNMQPDTPVENVLALYEAYKEFGSYP